MRVVIPGGSGQIGSLLARHYNSRGDHVTVLTRSPATYRASLPLHHKIPWRLVEWDGRTLGPWTELIDGADLVINLAGRSVNCRYTPDNLRAMMDSRVESTRVIGAAIAAAARPPRLWLQASTSTIYSHRFDAPNDELTGQIGGDEPPPPHPAAAPAYWKKSIDIARNWERELDSAATPNTRKVALRSSMTMSPDRGGVFDALLTLVRRGMGGPAGNGRQYVSWVHHTDFVRALDWISSHDDLVGPVNITAPSPLPNAAFMRELRHAWLELAPRRLSRLPARLLPPVPIPIPLLSLGAIFLSTDPELILKSRRVVPTRLLQSGFAFEFPDWPVAARHLCRRWLSSSLIKPGPES